MKEEIRYEDYIYSDKEEQRVKETCSDAEYVELLKEHRGIYSSKQGNEDVDCNKFVKYVLESKRICFFRLENGERYFRNREKKCYECVSEDTFSMVLFQIMAEYNEKLYTLGREKIIIHLCDLKARVFSRLPQNNRYIVFPNGTFDLKHKKFINKFSKKILNTYTMEYEYDESEDCPHFKEFLDDVFNSDRETIKCLQEFLGYTLVLGEAPADKILFLYSRGRSGKSVITNTIANILGSDNVSSIPLHKLNERFSLSSIYGKYANVCSEASAERLYNTSTLKSLSGRDKVTIEKKYENPYHDYIWTKIIIVSNNYLRLDDDSHGMWERIIAILLPNIYVPLKEGEEMKEGIHYQNPNLENELMGELSGIFNFFIEGLKRLEANDWNFTQSENSEGLMNQLLLLNKPVKYFVEHFVIADDNAKVSTAQVHTAFKQWCENNEIQIGEYSLPQKFHAEFKNVLLSLGIDHTVRKISIDYYIGLSIDANYMNSIGS